MSTSEHHPVFTYGTLLSTRVLQAILGRVPLRQRATLYGYTRHPIRNECYPVIIKTPPPHNHTTLVEGMVLLDITAPELALLDRFEDSRYDRAEELVQIESQHAGAQRVDTVRARVWARPTGNLDDVDTAREWSERRFREVDEDWYVRCCASWGALNRIPIKRATKRAQAQ